MPKKIIIDRADRLYQMPRSTDEFYPQPSVLGGRKTAVIDLGRPSWGGDSVDVKTESGDWSADSLKPADKMKIGELHAAIAEWAATELGIKLNPEREVVVAGGTRELLSLTGMAYLDPGDLALYPNPGYPAYRQTIITYGAESLAYHLTEKREFMPRLKQFSERLGRAARVMFINNPHNPSGTELDMERLDELLWLAARENLLLVNDAAYIAFSGNEDVSLMGSPSGRRIGLEFYSLTFLRASGKLPVAFAIGSRDLISGLRAAAHVQGSELLSYRVDEAIEALGKYPSAELHSLRSRVREAWAPAIELCETLGLTPVSRQGFPYLLARAPQRTSSQSFSATIMRRYGLVTLPGVAFGDLAEGYIRLTLTGGPLLYQEALERVKSRKLRAG